MENKITIELVGDRITLHATVDQDGLKILAALLPAYEAVLAPSEPTHDA